MSEFQPIEFGIPADSSFVPIEVEFNPPAHLTHVHLPDPKPAKSATPKES